jgi:hypothetical protein
VNAIPLFGSYIDAKTKDRILEYKKLYVWLDEDKVRYAMSQVQNMRSIGVDAVLISTKEDPKQYLNMNPEWRW